MPLFILIVGVLLITIGINNKVPELNSLISDALRPKNNEVSFITWVLAIIFAGSLGYISGFKPVANAFLVLIIIAIVLSNRGFIAKFVSALEGK